MPGIGHLVAGSWEDLGTPGEGIWSLRELRVAGAYQTLHICLNSQVFCFFVCLFVLITCCGYIADELEITCPYTTSFPEIAHYGWVGHGCI